MLCELTAADREQIVAHLNARHPQRPITADDVVELLTELQMPANSRRDPAYMPVQFEFLRRNRPPRIEVLGRLKEEDTTP
jgi:hypothetical protein